MKKNVFKLCIIISGIVLFNIMVFADPIIVIPSLNADALVTNLMGLGVTYSNAVYTGDLSANGSFTGGTGIIGFEQGLILSSGAAAAVVGPNNSGGQSTEFVGPGDVDLSIIGGVETYDAAVLEFDFVPSAGNLSFQFVFASEEYNEYVGNFNDIFGLFLNGVNVAILPSTTTVISIDNINNCVNSSYYINNNTAGGSAVCGLTQLSANLNTQFDGLTVVITLNIPVTPGVSHHFKFAVADALDTAYDSAIFIRGSSFISGTPSNTPTISPTWTETETFTVTPTVTPTFTVTDTLTVTLTFTVTPTLTETPTITETSTITLTQTITVTTTPTITPLPFCLALRGNFPNPAAFGTDILFYLCRPSEVKVSIFDVSGEKVRELNQSGVRGNNDIYWDGRNNKGQKAASGVFIYSLEALSEGERDKTWGKCAMVK